MEITESKVSLKAFGQDLELHAPTARQAAKFYKEMKNVDDVEEQIEKSIEFLVTCKMPAELAGKLELHQLENLISSLATKKK